MAIIILGHSKCLICGSVLQEGAIFLNVPSIFNDRANRFYEQTDTGIHQACFILWSLAPEFREAYRQFWLYEHQAARRMLKDGSFVSEE